MLGARGAKHRQRKDFKQITRFIPFFFPLCLTLSIQVNLHKQASRSVHQLRGSLVLCTMSCQSFDWIFTLITAKLPCCSALAKTPGKVCIPGQVASEFESMFDPRERERERKCGCESVFPTTCVTLWCCLICTASPASTKLPHILLDAFQNVSVLDESATRTQSEKQHRIRD